MNDNTAPPSLTERLSRLAPARRRLVEKFLSQIVEVHDPDAVHAFLEWRSDPRLDSLLDLAAALDDDRRDQLLFFAEDLFTEQGTRKPRVRA